MKFHFYFIFSLFLLLSTSLFGQFAEEEITDTISEQKAEVAFADTIPVVMDSTVRSHSPRKAAIYSAILPGLGQAYNRKWWKLPVVYGGFAFFGITAQQNHVLYKDFRLAYEHKILNDGSDPVNEYEAGLTKDQLLLGKRSYRRDRDYMIILSSLWYILNIVDASVDAHLFYWEVDDDLSLRLEPDFNYYSALSPSPTAGFSLKLKF